MILEAHMLGDSGACSPKSFENMVQFGAFFMYILIKYCLEKLPIFYIKNK